MSEYVVNRFMTPEQIEEQVFHRLTDVLTSDDSNRIAAWLMPTLLDLASEAWNRGGADQLAWANGVLTIPTYPDPEDPYLRFRTALADPNQQENE